MKLYEIENLIANFEPEVDENTGELLNADLLDRLNMAREDKLESICLYIKNLSAEAAAIKAEKDALAERQKQKERNRDSLLRYLGIVLHGEKFETAKCKVAFRKTVSVEIEDGFIGWAEKARSDLLRYKAPEADKAAIKEALKAGEAIPGAVLVENVSLTVK